VVNETHELMGMISEGDLIMRQAPTERRPWWHFFLLSDEQLAREFQKRAGTTVGEVMTRRVISVSPDLDLATADALLHHHRIRRLPVLAGRRVVGVVSRHDIVTAVAEAPSGLGVHIFSMVRGREHSRRDRITDDTIMRRPGAGR
jgi:CBS-domain-containing membrane protein